MSGGERETDPLGGGLTHNPFAALTGGKARPAPATDAPATERAPAPLDTSARLVVRKERKGHGGKTVTRVEGLAPAPVRKDYARDLARGLGAGARVDGDDVVVQGDLAARVADWLEERGHRVVRGN